MKCCENINYRIKIGGGKPSKNIQCWFDKMSISPSGEADVFLIEGKIKDQAELYSILIKIRDLGLKLISVERV